MVSLSASGEVEAAAEGSCHRDAHAPSSEHVVESVDKVVARVDPPTEVGVGKCPLPRDARMRLPASPGAAGPLDAGFARADAAVRLQVARPQNRRLAAT